MHRISGRRPRVTRDTAARVVARVGLRRVVDTHGDDVTPVREMRRKVEPLRRVAVRPMAEERAVDPDVAVHVYAVELEPGATAGGCARKRERLAIPANARRQIADATTTRTVLGVRPFDAPVVRHVDGAPTAVVERRDLRARRVAAREAPSRIQ